MGLVLHGTMIPPTVLLAVSSLSVLDFVEMMSLYLSREQPDSFFLLCQCQ